MKFNDTRVEKRLNLNMWKLRTDSKKQTKYKLCYFWAAGFIWSLCNLQELSQTENGIPKNKIQTSLLLFKTMSERRPFCCQYYPFRKIMWNSISFFCYVFSITLKQNVCEIETYHCITVVSYLWYRFCLEDIHLIIFDHPNRK